MAWLDDLRRQKVADAEQQRIASTRARSELERARAEWNSRCQQLINFGPTIRGPLEQIGELIFGENPTRTWRDWWERKRSKYSVVFVRDAGRAIKDINAAAETEWVSLMNWGDCGQDGWVLIDGEELNRYSRIPIRVRLTDQRVDGEYKFWIGTYVIPPEAYTPSCLFKHTTRSLDHADLLDALEQAARVYMEWECDISRRRAKKPAGPAGLA